MAQIKGNLLIMGISGSLSGMVQFRQVNGKTIVCKPRRSSPPYTTEKALAVKSRFRMAVGYARMAIKDPEKKAFYQSKVTGGRLPYHLALADALTPPKVESINSSLYHGGIGESISIRATDNFKVVSVKVSISDGNDSLIETGFATQQMHGNDWLYTTTKSNFAVAGCKISAVAKDLPANTGSLEVTL